MVHLYKAIHSMRQHAPVGPCPDAAIVQTTVVVQDASLWRPGGCLRTVILMIEDMVEIGEERKMMAVPCGKSQQLEEIQARDFEIIVFSEALNWQRENDRVGEIPPLNISTNLQIWQHKDPSSCHR